MEIERDTAQRGWRLDRQITAGVVLAILIARSFNEPLAAWLAHWVSTPSVRLVLSYGSLFFGTLLTFSLLGTALRHVVHGGGLNLTDRMLGGLFGVLRGALLVLVALMLMALFAPLLAPHDPIAQELSRRLLPPGTTVTEYFAGISDMSFFGEADEAALTCVAANSPVWHSLIRWPQDGAIAQVPTVNIGPWGRDYHTPLERLNTDHAFHHLPHLLCDVVTRVLG